MKEPLAVGFATPQRSAGGLAVAVAAVVLWLGLPAWGMAIRDDADLADYAALLASEPFQATGRFNSTHSGNLIAPRWVLASAHGPNASTFTTVHGSASVSRRIVFPGDPDAGDVNDGFDFALFELADPMLVVDAVELYPGTAATLQGQTVVYTGSGSTGTGDTGAIGGRQLLAGRNILDVALSDSPANLVASDFDAPALRPLFDPPPLEMGLAGGDSGGGLYVQQGGQYVLAGVHSAVTDPDDDGVFGEYGQLNLSTILTDAVRAWIDQALGPQQAWTGSVSGTWDASSANFAEFGDPTTYAAGAEVVFDDDAARFTVQVTQNLDSGGLIVNTEGAYVFTGAGTLTGSGGVFKTGGGSVEIANANAFTGDTIVDRGTLIVSNAAGSATGSGRVEVRAAGVLAGAGAVAGDVLNQGTARPDGILEVGGRYDQLSGSILDIELDPFTDRRVAITGDTALAGTLVLSIASGYAPAYGDRFDLVHAASVTGTFDTLLGTDAGAIDGRQAGLAVVYEADAVSAIVAVAGDANLDMAVSFADFQILQGGFGEAGTWGDADFNADGVVDLADFALLEANFGYDAAMGVTEATSATVQAAFDAFVLASIPEPATWVVLAGGLAGVSRWFGRGGRGQ